MSVRLAVERKVPLQSDYQSKVREEESKLLLGEDMLRYCISEMKVLEAVGEVPWLCNINISSIGRAFVFGAKCCRFNSDMLSNISKIFARVN